MQSHITLTELQRLVKSTLDERFVLPIWISAEISEIKVNYSGHCYMELIEKEGDKNTPTAQTRAVIWRNVYPRVADDFEFQTGQQLKTGIKILAKVIVTYHELYGFSLQIIDIDPAYTLGEVERQKQITINQLQKDGVWEMNHQIQMPIVAQRVAVVSSANAAGYQDFCKEASASAYAIKTTLFDAVMQGDAAEESLVGALCRIAEKQELFDVVVIIRGGGSTNDLGCFNSYRLCSHITQFPLPVITGIGHDKDTSIADMVAHTTLKTPTAVAHWIVERISAFDATLDSAAMRLHEVAVAATHSQEILLERLRAELCRHSQTLLASHKFTAEALVRSLPLAVTEFIDRQRIKLSTASDAVESRSPQRILQLGFAIVRNGSSVVKSVNEVVIGDTISIEIADGIIQTEVKNR